MAKLISQPITTDLVVAGGGLSGVIAAIAAKRTSPSMDIWLIEQYGFLGGMATAGYVFPMMGYSTLDPVSHQRKRIIGGIFQEIMERMHHEGYTEPHAKADCYARFDPMMLRCLLDEMVEEAKIHILFHAVINSVDVQNENSRKSIVNLSAQTKAGSIEFQPRWVIDATGDGDVMYHAGAEYILGRELDNLTQPGTLNFRIGNIKWYAPNNHEMGRIIRKEKSKGAQLTPRDDCLAFMTPISSERHFNQTRVANFDFTDPFQMTQAEIEGRHQTKNFIQFLRKKVRGYKKSSVVGLGTQLGLRETRHILGDYIITEQDIVDLKIFDDRICIGNYPIDIHDPKGSASTDMRRIPPGKFYSIPFHALIPKEFDNVLVAGRPISATHEAHAAFRVMPICSAIGQAAGVAIGLIFQEKNNLPEITCRDLSIDLIQKTLRSQNSILD